MKLLFFLAAVVLSSIIFSQYVFVAAIIAAIVASIVQIIWHKQRCAENGYTPTERCVIPNADKKVSTLMQKVARSWVFALILGLASNALLFGVFMWFLPFVLLLSIFFGLQMFLNEGVNSLPKIRWHAAFLSGATLGWALIYFFYYQK